MRRWLLFVSASVSTLGAAACGGHRHHARAPLPPNDVAVVHVVSIDAIADERARSASGARGGARMGTVMHGETLRRREVQELEVELDTAHCYWFGAATDEMGQRVGLEIVDPTGLTVASERAKWSDATLEYCPAVDGIYRVETKLHHHGHYALAVYAGARAQGVVRLTSAPLRVVDGASAEHRIAQRAAVVAPGARPMGPLFEGSKGETYWSTSLRGGSCYWLIGAAETNAQALWLDVWDASDRPVGTAGGSNVATVQHCPTASGIFKLRARVAGGGVHKVAVYQRE